MGTSARLHWRCPAYDEDGESAGTQPVTPASATIPWSCDGNENGYGMLLRLAVVAVGWVGDREGPEAGKKDHQTDDVPAEILRKTVVHDAEPGEHLSEQPAAQAIGNAHLRAAPASEAAVIETHIDHLDERVDPGEHADAAKLEEETGLAYGGRTEAVEHPHDEADEERKTEQHGAHLLQSFGGEPGVAIGGLVARTETGHRWNHANLTRPMAGRGNRLQYMSRPVGRRGSGAGNARPDQDHATDGRAFLGIELRRHRRGSRIDLDALDILRNDVVDVEAVRLDAVHPVL